MYVACSIIYSCAHNLFKPTLNLAHLAGRSGIGALPFPLLYGGSKAAFGDIGGKGGTAGGGSVFASLRRLLELRD